ncbi:hypothetical protein A2415_01375 [candidate division WWE3 bacterium RIFOXYC1_FULL_39_7]|uniref:Uncharacterized protein n=1 Tax=candidate division WWE3 bacterium RIFOXYC1_FULL_39_7 TaxID=1802643 RepID=A0A1F4WGA7_UNCKA|nr:MAG: hypothetical protein A2415_01375 [candidate division WWE3 bacterium RIFOXYC1_FULL_39_7]
MSKEEGNTDLVFRDIAESTNGGKPLLVFFVIPSFEFVDDDFILFFPSIEKVGDNFAMRATVAPVVFKFGRWAFDGDGRGGIGIAREEYGASDNDNNGGNNNSNKAFIHENLYYTDLCTLFLGRFFGGRQKLFLGKEEKIDNF